MTLYSFFENSLHNFPNHTALVIQNQDYQYENLGKWVNRILPNLQKSSELVGILAYRSLTAYLGILASLKAGKTYVPLNPKFPKDRNELIGRLAGFDTLIVGSECIEYLSQMSDLQINTYIFPENTQAEIQHLNLGKAQIFTQENLSGNSSVPSTEIRPEQYAYLLFTSGSTGIPKGVPISHENVCGYIDYVKARYQTNENDRFSQTFDLTFDLSVHDMFLCWASGAALYVIPEKSVMAPAKFIKENELTVWFSVPSVGQMMARLGMLKPDAFPSLRLSLFCGEPMPLSLAEKWEKTAPNSLIENIYGPTEATIAITHYSWKRGEINKSLNGIVSIGKIFSSQEVCLINEKSEKTEQEGELCLGGTQITDGYWKNPEKTAQQFIKLPFSDNIWYKTGDLVRKDTEGEFFYLSRIDFQVKIRGYRIELDEINHLIRQFTDNEWAYSVPFPVKEGIAENIYTFVHQSVTFTPLEIIAFCKTKLPDYMIPKNIIFIEDFPLNANGKVDILQLSQKLTQI